MSARSYQLSALVSARYELFLVIADQIVISSMQSGVWLYYKHIAKASFAGCEGGFLCLPGHVF